MQIEPAAGFCGHLAFSGDKSISHRLVLISLLLDGTMLLRNLSEGEDVKTSLKAVQALGVEVSQSGRTTSLAGVRPPSDAEDKFTEIYCGNSGTTARLLAGLLSSRPGRFRLTGDESLCRRPMLRIIEPLRQMGADIVSENGLTLPIIIRGQNGLKKLNFFNKLSSAQVKSAILLAALNADGTTSVSEPLASRDHTELLFARLGLPITVESGVISVTGKAALHGSHDFTIPGDISSAAFFAVGAAIIPGSRVVLQNVLLNPKRIRFLDVLLRMGAGIQIERISSAWETSGNITVTGGKLQSTEIRPEEVPPLIDELPALAVAMAFAEGTSRVSGAGELRHKETDRIRDLISQLQLAGISCTEQADGFSITGPATIAEHHFIDPAGDHRLAMAFAILGCNSRKGLFLRNPGCINISCPEFFRFLQNCTSG